MANPAINLQQVIKFFNPAQSLSGQNLRTWFVPRPETPRSRVRVFLQAETDPVKILFVGHRGSGKSTELNKLAEELGGRFFPIRLDVLEVIGSSTPGYEDLMRAMSTFVTRQCINAELIGRPINEPLRNRWQELSDWWHYRISGLEVRPGAAETTTYAQLSVLLGDIEVGARQSAFDRERIRAEISRRMPELVRYLNMVIQEAHSGPSGRRLLIIVENLDKVDLDSARNIFREHAATITAPEAAMIFTFPLALRHSEDYRTVRGYFSNNDYFLQNIALHHLDGTEDGAGWSMLRRLVRTRLRAELLADGVLDRLVAASGGIPVDLVKLVRNAAVYALARNEDAACIEQEDAQNAINDLQRETGIPLSMNDWELLHRIHATHRLSNEPDIQRLIYAGAIIEYANERPWCDVHPVLWDLLDYYAPQS